MTTRFDTFAKTALGQTIASTIDTPDRLSEFAAFSREGYPAVTALRAELAPILEPLRTADPKQFNSAKQFVGWYVAGIMRAAGFSIRQDAKNVPGKLFSVGAWWTN